MVHELKIERKYFLSVFFNKKRFELRKNDRDYKVGDTLALKEFNNGVFSGLVIYCKITYILKNVPNYGLNKDYVILSIEKL